VGVAITRLVDSLVSQTYEGFREVELIGDVFHSQLATLFRFAVFRGGGAHFNELDEAEVRGEERLFG
jgi:hypothetical protein